MYHASQTAPTMREFLEDPREDWSSEDCGSCGLLLSLTYKQIRRWLNFEPITVEERAVLQKFSVVSDIVDFKNEDEKDEDEDENMLRDILKKCVVDGDSDIDGDTDGRRENDGDDEGEGDDENDDDSSGSDK